MILLLTIILTFSQPTQRDIAYVSKIACGESCGMPDDCIEFVIWQLRYDYERVGSFGLRKRWYAPLKGSIPVLEMTREVFSADKYKYSRCRLIGNAADVQYWRENGYLLQDEQPDYQWHAHGMSVLAFGCGK